MVVLALLLLSLGLLTAQAQDCSRPVAGANMHLKGEDILLQTFEDGKKVSFACEVGYTPVGGSAAITCTAGSWSPLRFRCEIKNCGPVEAVDNAQIEYSEQGPVFGEKAVITCNEGFILVGRREIICGDQGWLNRVPVCEVVKCDPPAVIVDGKFSPYQESYEYREVVQYSCKSDYTLNGSKILSCSEDGRFTPHPPTCTRVECGHPTIGNGTWKEGARPPYRHLAAVTLQCNSGFKMNGSATQTCNISSQWSPGLPQCTPVECKDPKIENGDRKEGLQPPYRYSSMVTLQCSAGYVLKGSATQTCDINGLWSPGLPECKWVECKDPKIENGDRKEGSQPPYKHLSKVTLECSAGYIMTGSATQTCDINGLWSPGLPECKWVECKDPKIENGDRKEGSQPPYRYSSMVKLQCSAGYVLKGSATQTCDINGLWSPGLPECKSVECKVPKIENGEWKEGSQPPYRYSSMVTLQCSSGYTLTGSSIVTCDKNGEWSPGLPVCKSSGNNLGAILGGLFGGLVGLSAICCCIYCLFCGKSKRSRKDKTDQEAAKEGENVSLS